MVGSYFYFDFIGLERRNGGGSSGDVEYDYDGNVG